MTPNISITLNTPHVTIERYSELTGLPLSELTSDLVTRLNEYGVGQDESTH